MNRIRYCPKCKEYTLKEYCPKCKEKSIINIPPRYSPNSRLAKYRRQVKRTILQKEGLL